MLYALLYFAVFFAIFKALKTPSQPAALASMILAIIVQSIFAAVTFGTWVWAIPVLLLAPYWLGPFLIHETQRFSTEPALVPFDPTSHATPEEIEAPRQESVRALIAAGFRPLADLFLEGHTPNVTIRVTLLENLATRQQAIACGMWTGTGAGRSRMTWVEFLSRFSDGRSLIVNNSSQLSVYAPVRERIAEILPEMRDVVQLARVHRALSDHLRGAAQLEVLSDEGDPAGYLSRSLTRESATQLATGYLRVDTEAGVFRPTAKGAFLMTWKLLPPFSTLRRARVGRRAAALLRTLGLDADNGPDGGAPAGTSVPWVTAAILLACVGATGGSLVPRLPPLGADGGLAAGIVVPGDFRGAVETLEHLAGDPSTPLIVTDSFGTRQRVDGAVVRVEAKRADAIIAAVQGPFQEKGFYLFRLDQNYGIGGEPDELALVPQGDAYAVVELVGTNGANYDISTRAIIDTLRAIGRDEPFVLTGIGHDYLEGRFVAAARNPAALAHRFYALCPDIVHQGTGTVEALATEIRKTNTLYCWWD